MSWRKGIGNRFSGKISTHSAVYCITDFIFPIRLAATTMPADAAIPLNPVTTISYSVHSRGNITLDVYDIQGRLGYNLVNTNHSPGIYSVAFDAGDLAGGIYFYRLNIDGNKVSVRKMILLR